MMAERPELRVAELFAGVGGFRLALEGHAPSGLSGSGWRVVWSNQWEPSTKRQDASDCYVAHFGRDGHSSEDIERALNRIERGESPIPEINLLVGGFPCQDYSVAKVLPQSAGLEGKKGVLWWQIHRMLKLTRPRFVFLENVDRLLKSPATQRGRDFGVMLSCLAELGYLVEWRVVNAADYGFPQRRRRVLIVGERRDDAHPGVPSEWILESGILARSLPAIAEIPQQSIGFDSRGLGRFALDPDILAVSKSFQAEFRNAGAMWAGDVWSLRVRPTYDGHRAVLRDVLQSDDDVADDFFIPDAQIPKWEYHKGAKKEQRTVARNGFSYFYAEGAISFPDSPDQPSRTILTGEGGTGPSRFKHVIRTSDGRLRRLTPLELERLNGFPQNWTDTGMSPARRAFMMGNALVVGLVRRVGLELSLRAAAQVTLPTEALARHG